MKKLWPLVLLLAACTGSQEPSLPALVAAGSGEKVGFFRARDLQQGGAASPVATWSAPGLQDLAYAGAFQRLYLLFADRLEAYPTSGFTETSVPKNLLVVQALPADCTGGYLRLGQNRLLVHCPRAQKAFLLGLPDPGPPQEADLTGLDPALRLALLPQGGLDLLAYLTPAVLGFRPAQDPGATPRLEKPLDPPLQTPLDLRADGQGRLLGLGTTPTEVRFYALQGEGVSSRKVLGDFPGEARLALDPAVGLGVYGQGFQVLEPRDSGPQEVFTTFAAGLVGQDGYLYLAAGTLLSVYDLVPSPPQRVATSSLDFAPKALAFLPVQ
ncbi:hypothetical protein [Thermus islandicus]|uniref:hypothetical protein n=1 Tax=Thermus islandicus TaxID=540988 RepID=UPI0003B6D801|nr:hypothetical protein [Thermus islandicus]